MQIRPIRRTDGEGGFSCGEPALDTFLAKRAWTHEQNNVARVYVLDDETAPGIVLGFYTLAANTIERERVRASLPASLPKYPFPVFYVGHFAVTLQQQRRGLGRRLMGDALRRCLEGAAHVGAVGVYLDSLDDRSTAFYRRLGFAEIARAPGTPAGGPQPMFLPVRDLQAAKPAGA